MVRCLYLHFIFFASVFVFAFVIVWKVGYGFPLEDSFVQLISNPSLHVKGLACLLLMIRMIDTWYIWKVKVKVIILIIDRYDWSSRELLRQCALSSDLHRCHFSSLWLIIWRCKQGWTNSYFPRKRPALLYLGLEKNRQKPTLIQKKSKNCIRDCIFPPEGTWWWQLIMFQREATFNL